MFKSLLLKLGRFIVRTEMRELKEALSKSENETNQRVSKILSEMDPFEPLMKEFHGIFSKDFQRMEEGMDERSQLQFFMWAHRQCNDPYFKYATEWVMNTAGNETMKKAPISAQRTMYGRAQIANMMLFRKEIGRLSSRYEEILENGKPKWFDEHEIVD